MLLFNKKILILIILSALTLNLFAESLPNGYKDVKLGMSLQETKETLVKYPDFGYH